MIKLAGIIIPLFAAVVSIWGIYKNNRTKLAADIVAKSKLDWIQEVELHLGDLIISVSELNGLLYNSKIDNHQFLTLEEIDQSIDLYHVKENNIQKAGNV